MTAIGQLDFRLTTAGLFDPKRTPLLTQIRLGDAVMAEVIDVLSFEKSETGRRYINYRDLGVQQFGSIYERLLERRRDAQGRRNSSSAQHFRPQERRAATTPPTTSSNSSSSETIDPIVSTLMEAFSAKAKELETVDLAGGPQTRNSDRLRPRQRNCSR